MNQQIKKIKVALVAFVCCILLSSCDVYLTKQGTVDVHFHDTYLVIAIPQLLLPEAVKIERLEK